MTLIRITEILEELIKVSEKSAQIARLFRADDQLFKLLVQEKSNETKNPRFVQDFKTLADVLVQQTIKYDLSLKFRGIEDRIFGEENNKFENSLGESVVVRIQSCCQSTSDLLLKVLDGNKKAADLLANAVHTNQTNCLDQHLNTLIEQNFELQLSVEDIAIWIDPIDSTSEYVNGIWQTNGNKTEGIITSGLQCVTNLIGVYDIKSGRPLIGIANQPFVSSVDSFRDVRYSGRYYWGFDINGIQENNFSDQMDVRFKGIVLIGGNETQTNINALKPKSKVVYASGAGHKLLMTALGFADIYINSQPSTYRWDTCGPHAILRSIGGGIITFNETIALKENIINHLNDKQLNYFEYKSEDNAIKKCCNSSGIIAYNSIESLKLFLNYLVID